MKNLAGSNPAMRAGFFFQCSNFYYALVKFSTVFQNYNKFYYYIVLCKILDIVNFDCDYAVSIIRSWSCLLIMAQR
jgi:hypothetical protein